jgi:hypothetical protein
MHYEHASYEFYGYIRLQHVNNQDARGDRNKSATLVKILPAWARQHCALTRQKRLTFLCLQSHIRLPVNLVCDTPLSRAPLRCQIPLLGLH